MLKSKALEADRDALQGTAVKYAEVKTWLNTFIEQTLQGDALTTVDGTTMKMLVDRIWTDGAEYVDENALSVTVGRLRKKLNAAEYIKTVYGIGYVWRSE